LGVDVDDIIVSEKVYSVDLKRKGGGISKKQRETGRQKNRANKKV
jgi:hypothetical protein